MSHVIIGIHGLANKPPQETQHQGWIDAIQEGLKRNLALAGGEFNFRSVYWADVLYPKPLDPDPEPYLPATGKGALKTYRDGWLAEVEAGILGVGGKAIDAAKRWFGMDQVADVVLKEKLDDLYKYYHDKRIRDTLRGLLLESLKKASGSRIMLIAHSMGTIIAYDVLRDLGRSEPRFALDHFLTIGSPLGLPHVKRKIFEESRLVRTPSVVKQWTNFADRRDPVAVDVHLADDYQPNDADVQVRDDLVINGYQDSNGKANYHKLYGYLRTPEVSQVISRFI